jgi:hypothetical protein
MKLMVLENESAMRTETAPMGRVLSSNMLKSPRGASRSPPVAAAGGGADGTDERRAARARLAAASPLTGDLVGLQRG